MRFVIKKTIATLAIFLVVPLFIIAINWHWLPDSLNNKTEYFFWITETASYPWAIITSIIFFILFCALLTKKSDPILKKITLIWVILVAVLLSGQIIKSIIKSQTAEPRPYVLWMSKEFNISDQYFYSLSKPERAEKIHQLLKDSTVIPGWLSKHWQNETGYSFPSGHTLFSTTFAFLAIMLLSFRRHYFIITSVILWAVLIELSRLLLGMHSPIDLILAIIIAWCISLIGYVYARKWHIVDK